jgi:hypothetical protein
LLLRFFIDHLGLLAKHSADWNQTTTTTNIITINSGGRFSEARSKNQKFMLMPVRAVRHASVVFLRCVCLFFVCIFCV